MLIRQTFIAVAVAAAFGISAPAWAQSVSIAIGSEPTTLDPQLRLDGGMRAVNDNIYEALLQRDAQGELSPLLAAEMPRQIDDVTWELNLREGISFTNGEPFDAEAAAFSINRVIDPDFGSQQASFFVSITGAEAVDTYTLQITTNGPDQILPARLYLLKMVPPLASEADGFASNPVGTGPYLFERWDRGNSIDVVVNPDYWGDAPEIQSAHYRFIGEFGTRFSTLLSGETDLITNLLPEFVERAPRAVTVAGLEIPIVILNVDGGPTADVRVRRALNLALDKEAIAEAIFAGYADVARGQLMAPSFFGFNPDIEGYGFDPELARELISEAGAEGVQVDLVGTAGRWLKDRELVEVVANSWNEVGVNTNVRIFEFTEYLNRLFDRETRADAIFVVASNELLDADRPMATYYHMNGRGASNSNEEMAEMIDRARNETDVAVRLQLYHDVLETAFEDAYFAFLLNINDIYGTSERLVWEPRIDSGLHLSTMSLQ